MKIALGLTIGIAIFFLLAFMGSEDELEEQEYYALQTAARLESCQNLLYEIDGILTEVDGDYELFAEAISDYVEGNISLAKFSNQIYDLPERKDSREYKYQYAFDRYSDNCLGF